MLCSCSDALSLPWLGFCKEQRWQLGHSLPLSLTLCFHVQWPAQRAEKWDWHQHPVNVRDSWSLREMDLGGDTAKPLLSTTSCAWVSSRTLALREHGVLDLETRRVRPALALNKGRRRAVLSKMVRLLGWMPAWARPWATHSLFQTIQHMGLRVLRDL